MPPRPRPLETPRLVLLAALSTGLAIGCGEAPAFDAEAYEVVTTSSVLVGSGASGWAQGENWAQPFNAYVPGFCDATVSSTTVTEGGRVVIADWHACSSGASDIVGPLESVGGGAYEGLLEVTVRIRNVPTVLGLVLRLEPRSVE